MLTIFQKITDLPPAVTVKGTDTFEMVSSQLGTLASVEVSADQIAAYAAGAGTNGVTIVTSNPSGALTATPGKLVFDSNGTALWLKVTGTDNNGWTQLI